MAKAKKTGTKQAKQAATPKEGPQVVVLIKQSTLKNLLKQDDNYKRDIDGLVGELREAIGNASEKQHLDKKAYALLKRFHREKSSEKLWSLWHTLLAYMEMAGVMDRINSVQAIDFDGEQEAEDYSQDEEETEDEETSGVVTRPEFGAARY